MNPAQLLSHFDRIGEAPEAIPRLRRFILDLAVRGKLVEQDPRDEPAAELLKRIQIEKSRLVQSGEIKKEKPLPAIEVDEIPFALPAKWEWVRLKDITSYIQRGKSPKYATGDGLPVISQKCVQWGGLNLDSAKFITRESIEGYEAIRFLRNGDLLWNSTGTGTIGRIIKVKEPSLKLVCDSHVTVVRCLEVNAEYVRSWIRSDHVYGMIEDRAAGSTNQVELTSQIAMNQIVPLPPLAEQHRIVAKVDELMALCDRLEAAQTDRESRRDRLVASSLHRLNNGAEAEAFRKHARFYFNHLPRLTTRPDHIKQLRQTILNLAVRGKLVEQNPTDEPASELLKRIEAARKRPMRVRQPENENSEETVAQKLLPIETPDNWVWAPFSVLPIESGVGIDRGRQHQGPDKMFGYFKMNNIRNGGGVDLTNLTRVDANKDEVQTFSLHDGDFLFNTRNSRELVGKTCVYRSTGEGVLLYNNNILRAKLMDGFAPEFLDYWFRCSFGQIELERLKSNTTNVCAIYQGKLSGFQCPLPPLAEQQRIVAKVDELMALCDQLETQLTTTQSESRHLLEAILHEAITPA